MFLASVLFACIAITGCGQQTFALDAAEDGSSVTLTSENAGEDMFVTGGSLVVKKGQKVVMEPAFEDDGQVSIKLIPVVGGDVTNPKEVEESAAEENAVLDETVGGEEKAEFDVAPGEYYVSAGTPSKGLTGTLVISAK